jgi:exopolysaccharide biosynthesis WecB/TagA/CpsF family protein
MHRVLNLDDYDLKDALKVAAEFGSDRYGYWVTPNVDHVIRYCADAQFRSLYEPAACILLDSRFLALLVRFLKGQTLQVCAGSDLTAGIFNQLIAPDDVAIVVGGSPEQAQILRRRYGLRALHHIQPPMNFVRDPAALDACVRAVESLSPFRFCFLAVGSPQQEIVARQLETRGTARGLALCIGASINFITGLERRAPPWMRRLGLEWLYRLSRNPKRLAYRYLVRGPRIFLLLRRIEFRTKRGVASCEADKL